jgi:hypothetical protein
MQTLLFQNFPVKHPQVKFDRLECYRGESLSRISFGSNKVIQ